jgi:hypothetical protein
MVTNWTLAVLALCELAAGHNESCHHRYCPARVRRLWLRVLTEGPLDGAECYRTRAPAKGAPTAPPSGARP